MLGIILLVAPIMLVVIGAGKAVIAVRQRKVRAELARLNRWHLNRT